MNSLANPASYACTNGHMHGAGGGEHCGTPAQAAAKETGSSVVCLAQAQKRKGEGESEKFEREKGGTQATKVRSSGRLFWQI